MEGHVIVTMDHVVEFQIFEHFDFRIQREDTHVVVRMVTCLKHVIIESWLEKKGCLYPYVLLVVSSLM